MTYRPRLPQLAILSLSLILTPLAQAQEKTGSEPSARAGDKVAQDGPKKFGTIFKRQVDGLINRLSGQSTKTGALGTGSCRDTAKILVAMAHSHRGYTLYDGPVVRRPVMYLFKGRKNNGSFANRKDDNPWVTTQWVVDALEAVHPDEHKNETDMARAWLKSRKADKANPWQSRVDAIKRKVAEQGIMPTEIGAAVAGKAMGPLSAEESTAVLLELVACQVVAKLMDEGDRELVPKTFSTSQQKGLSWLMTKQKDGVFLAVTKHGSFPDPGLTGMALAALMTKAQAKWSAAEKTAIDKGLAYIAKQQNEDGSFGQHVVNYTTCAAILALAKSNRAEYAPLLKKAQHYILGIQNIENRGYAKSDRDYGSIGYGGDQRGDLSNLQFAIEALKKTEIDENHEAFAKAIVFLQRTQNLSDTNDYRAKSKDKGKWVDVRGGNDGGSAYYPGNSPAGYDKSNDGAKLPRSYGSMTYAMLKTYIFCGLNKKDKRIVAAVKWMEENWTLSENPGASPLLPEKAKVQGLYYYYMVMAQALDIAGIDELEISKAEDPEAEEPIKVNWRKELKEQLQSIQKADGSWINQANGRWWEDQPAICTIYALLALERCNR